MSKDLFFNNCVWQAFATHNYFQCVAKAFLTLPNGGKEQLVIMVKSCENKTVGWKIFHPFTISFISILVISDLTIMNKK